MTDEAWPKLEGAARIGLVAEFLDVVELESESAPAGMLVDFLATFGNVVGVSPRMAVQADVHKAVINVVTVGRTSRGRKGTGRAFVRRVFAEADPQWNERCVVSGYASGEGIIADLADDNPGDPRRLVEEVEFSRVLRVGGPRGVDPFRDVAAALGRSPGVEPQVAGADHGRAAPRQHRGQHHSR